VDKENTLIRRAQAGDESAWAGVIAAHQEAMFRLACLISGDPADAEDITQEAIIRAYRALGRFDAARPARPWLLGITRNLARNRLRSARRYLNALTRAAREMPPTPDLETARDRRWLASRTWDAVKRLPGPAQEVIALRYFLECSVAETADALGVAEGTVKSRLSRALERLRALIEVEFPELKDGFPGE
jgi:RNA polymerase sigma-70 factor (ECF subfamily)